MADALIALATVVAARKPIIAMIVWESTPGKLEVRAIPESLYVAEILAVRAKELLHPDPDAGE